MAKKNQRTPLMAISFLCYCALMIFLLFERSPAESELSYWEQIQGNCNLIPWRTVGNYWDILIRSAYYMAKWDAAKYRYQAVIALINIGGNIAMFVPFGAFLPAVWQKLQHTWKAIGVGCLTIVLVEICQLFTLRGRCDIDDFFLNAIGIILGYGGWRMVQFCRRKKKH